MLLEHCTVSNMDEQDCSGKRNCDDQGRGSSGRSQSRNFSGGRGRGNCHKRNDDDCSNRKNNANGKNNDDNNGNSTSQSKIKCSIKDFKGGTKEPEDCCHDAAASNQANV